jgi:hypothetical protein
LDLHEDTIGSYVLPGTNSLTNLTCLSISHLYPDEGVPQLRHLPAQLQQLTMSLLCYESTPFTIDLSHVTGLTRLAAAGDGQVQNGWIVEQHDKLPPNCLHLSVQDVLSAQPLLQLHQLERLEVKFCWWKGLQTLQQLSRLSRLSSLTDLQVDIESELLDTDALQRLPSLKGLQLLHTCGRI